MVCVECREGQHSECEDTKHPDRLYRGCACQHQERPPKGESDDGE